MKASNSKSVSWKEGSSNLKKQIIFQWSKTTEGKSCLISKSFWYDFY